MAGPDLDLVRTLAAREVSRLADAIATLAATTGRLADWAEHWKRGQ